MVIKAMESVTHIKRHANLVGIDSDGCVFNSMEIKQRRYFMPSIIETWGLSEYAELVEHHVAQVNLYSLTRGGNRFPNLMQVFKELAREPSIIDAGVKLPDFRALQRYCETGVALGNSTLAEYVRANPDEELERVLEWSIGVSRAIDTKMEPPPMFAGAEEALRLMAAASDLVVVSQTPQNALRREWGHHGVDRYVASIAGQECGSKVKQLQEAEGGRYGAERVLMIGDAVGDLETAELCGVHFFPIIPGREEESWSQLLEVGYELFLSGEYGNGYGAQMVRSFRERFRGCAAEQHNPSCP